MTKEFYTKASGLLQLAESSKYLISPIIAGFLLQTMDIKEILLIDAATFLIAVFTVLLIRPNFTDTKPMITAQNFIGDFMEGFRYLFAKKEIMLLVSIISLIAFFIGLLQALLGPMILSFTNSKTFGISQTIATTGMLIGSSFISILENLTKKFSYYH